MTVALDTCVFLKRVLGIETTASKLVAARHSPATPPAIIQRAYWENERVVTGALENIAAKARRAHIEPPATFIVGEVVRLREALRQLAGSYSRQKEAEV